MTGLFILFIVCIVVWLRSHDKLGRVQAELQALKEEVAELKQGLNTAEKDESESRQSYEQDASFQSSVAETDESATPQSNVPLPNVEFIPHHDESQTETVHLYNDDTKSSWFQMGGQTPSLNSSSLLWVGAFILALGGVFLAKYTLESGLISPELRVLLGAGVGVVLIVAAEYLMRYPERFNIHTTEVSAALVAAGIVTCYSMSLVASHYYHFLVAPWSFIILAAISLIATFLALRFGPIVAGVGMVGAYAVPAFFWGQSQSVFQLLVYVALVSVSAIVVANRVRSRWLWWLSFAGHFMWFFIVLLLSKHTDIWLLLGFSVASLYLYVLSDVLGWKLESGNQHPLSIKSLFMWRKEQLGLLCAIIPIWAFYVLFGYQDALLGCTLVIVSILLLAPIKHSAFDTWPFLGLILSLVTFVLQVPSSDFNDDYFMFSGAHLYAQVVALAFFVYALYMQYLRPKRAVFSLLLVCSTVMFFGLAYILSPSQANKVMYSLWATELALFAAVALFVTKKSSENVIKLSGWLLANFHIALMCTMLLDSATLTLALTIQVAGIGYWGQKFNYVTPHWLIKSVLSLIILRLTLAPWIPPYLEETIVGIHWTIIVYPLVFVAFTLTRKWLNQPVLDAWFTAIRIHLIALFVTTETSYQLVGHYPELGSLTFQECILLALSWMVLATVYLYRSYVSSRLVNVYRAFSLALFLAAGLLYIQLSTWLNPYLTNQFIGEAFLLNWLTPLWLGPAIIFTVIVKCRLVEGRLKIAASALAALFAVVFINAMIRQPFYSGKISAHLGLDQIELYTYSLVWLLIALCLIVWSQIKQSQIYHKVGFIILAIVTAKAFVVDMSQLEGLYRALSFMGLGLCLIVIGWLFQRLKRGVDEPVETLE